VYRIDRRIVSILSHLRRLTTLLDLQGGPAKVRPTYIFAGNIILLTFECIGKIQWFLANVITV